MEWVVYGLGCVVCCVQCSFHKSSNPMYKQLSTNVQQPTYIHSHTHPTHTHQGRVACEINSGDELVATELIFSGLLNTLSPAEAVALMSALVFQERVDDLPRATPRLAAAQETLCTLAREAGVLQRQMGMTIDPDEFVQQALKFGLIEVVFEWANGTNFAEICQMTKVMEGAIVRTIMRLEETCREFRDAARIMGNTQLLEQVFLCVLYGIDVCYPQLL